MGLENLFGGYDWQHFGYSWVTVGIILLALVTRYVMVSEEAIKLLAAAWVVLGYFINALVVGEQLILPTTLPGWISLILGAVIVFGGVLGLRPGQSAGKVWKATAGRFVKRS